MAKVQRLDAAADARGGLGLGPGQLVRFAWFSANYRLAARRVGKPDLSPDLRARMPDTGMLVRALFALFREDRAQVRAGIYPAPSDAIPTPAQWLRQARAFFADLPKVDARRNAAGGNRDLRTAPPNDSGDLSAYPPYYTQNFHFQTDGYLSKDSADLYDYQVDVLFSGGADAMRRLCLPPLVEALARRGQRAPVILDLACGTGRTGHFIKQRWPVGRLVSVDLSPPYLAAARRNQNGLGRVHHICANGERLPFADGAFDAVTSVFTFHELPPKVRRIFAGEISRILRPGGRFVLVDSLQSGDIAAFDPLLDYFPRAYHEPYFASYQRTDLDALFAEAGFVAAGQHAGFLSKRCVYDRPA